MHFEVILVAAGANRVTIQVIQEGVNDAGHIRPVAPHPLIVFSLHINRNMLNVIRQGRRPTRFIDSELRRSAYSSSPVYVIRRV